MEILGGEFYSDDIADLGAKDAAIGTAGVWIVELAELAAMNRAEVEKVKAFLSRRIDRYRPPYARHYIWTPRQCVFGGSINLQKYLKDETGGRRFWPARCGHMNLDALRRDRDQLWAEAVVRYERGELWWLDTADLIADAAGEQEERLQADPWETAIETWLALAIQCHHRRCARVRHQERTGTLDESRRDQSWHHPTPIGVGTSGTRPTLRVTHQTPAIPAEREEVDGQHQRRTTGVVGFYQLEEFQERHIRLQEDTGQLCSHRLVG